MPEDLLLDVETNPPLARSLATVEGLVREALQHAVPVAEAVRGMQGSARSFEDLWQRIVLEVAKGQTAEMHAACPRLSNAITKRLSQLRDTHVVATWLRKLGSSNVPDPDILLLDIASMERLKTTVFDRWQTADDLEDLAARDYPLTTADLDRIGPGHAPAAAWYAEESKPF